MKTHHTLFLLIVFVLTPLLLFPQSQVIRAGDYAISSRTYHVKKIKDRLTIERKNSKISGYSQRAQLVTNSNNYIKINDHKAINKVIVQALGRTRIEELKKEAAKSIILTIYVNDNGRVDDISYLVHQDTKLRIDEIDTLTQALKDKHFFSSSVSFKNSGKVVPWVQVISFQKLLNL